jgi:hypothetical protein
VAAASGDPTAGRRHLEDAVDLFLWARRFEMARARVELARILGELGRTDAAAGRGQARGGRAHAR